MGIKESTLAQAVVTSINVCAMIFIIIAGSYLGFKTRWAGYELPAGYFPFGVNGMLAGSATVFFAYIGFDSVASTAEEVKNPQRDLPLGIGLALSVCCCLYMMVSVVIVGLVPYYAMDPDTPISSAFAAYGMQWAASQVPVKSTLVTGLGSAVLAFFMDVSELAGMEIIDSVSLRYSTGCQNVTKEKSVCGIGGALLLIGLIVLTCIEQDDARHNFGHSGGFICPFVPLLPIVCSLVNIYLLINLGAATWTRVSVWLIVGVLVYTFYGRTHSSLRDAVYVPATHADEIYRSSGES
uniref:Cationic amino acid transporter C-terminal domain-containing protein n=1 Tax=Salix viminalis TaxID=40686 RepID=A0A6N2NM04_SALVM